MNQSEIGAVFDELEEIKSAAFQAGRNAAIEEVNKQIEEIHAEQSRVANLRSSWRQILATVNKSFEDTYGHKLKTLMEPSAKTYTEQREALFSPENMEDFQEELVRLLKIAMDFEVIIQHIKTNEMLESQWNKLLVTMRMIEQ